MTNLCTYIQFHLHNISLSLLRDGDSARATRCSDLGAAAYLHFRHRVRHLTVKLYANLLKLHYGD